MWSFFRHRKPREVLVVGAGPVGQLAALELAERGIDVALVDSGSDGHRDSSVILHPGTLRLLAEIGVSERLVAAGRAITAIDVTDESGRRESFPLADLGAGDPPYALTLEARHLDYVLEERLRRLGVAVGWDHRCAGLRRAEGSVIAEIEELVEVTTGYAVPHREWEISRTFDLEAAFVVAADGAHSLVRRRLGMPTRELGCGRFAVFEGRGEVEDSAHIVLHGDGRAVFWPLPEGRWRWVIELHSDARPATLPGRRDLVPALGGWVLGRLQPETLRVFTQRRAPWFLEAAETPDTAYELWSELRTVEQPGSDRVWLAGDAAHMGGPLASASLNQGLFDARDLATRIAAILRGPASLALLDDYAGGRQRPDELSPASWVGDHVAELLAGFPVREVHEERPASPLL